MQIKIVGSSSFEGLVEAKYQSSRFYFQRPNHEIEVIPTTLQILFVN